jgi:hypothetical protein
VFIFSKDTHGRVRVDHPKIETYGTTYDEIIEECFGVRPPMSQEADAEIKEAMESKNAPKIEAVMKRLGYSNQKMLLADHLRSLDEGME